VFVPREHALEKRRGERLVNPDRVAPIPDVLHLRDRIPVVGGTRAVVLKEDLASRGVNRDRYVRTRPFAGTARMAGKRRGVDGYKVHRRRTVRVELVRDVELHVHRHTEHLQIRGHVLREKPVRLPAFTCAAARQGRRRLRARVEVLAHHEPGPGAHDHPHLQKS